MTTGEGIFTNAVYGYLSMLARLIQEERPTHIAAVFDLKPKTFRSDMYDGYKATRKPMPEELYSQLILLKEILTLGGIKIVELERYEADDVIGTLAKRFDKDTVVVSGDKDVLQLVDDSTRVFNTKRGVTDIKVYDLEALKEENLTPELVIDYKALAGDSSDNIPGCPGVGQKTAMGLLKNYKSVDGVYQNIEQLKGKLKERLAENKELVYLSRKLATIETNAPVKCELSDLLFNENMPAAFFNKLNEIECKSLIPRFKKALSAPSNEMPETDIAEGQAAKIITTFAPQSEEELRRLIPEKVDNFAFDLGVALSITFDGDKEIKISAPETFFDTGIGIDDALAILKPLLTGDAVKIVYDVKSAMNALRAYGIKLAPPYEDIYIKNYLLDSSKSPKSIEALAETYNMNGLAAAAYNLNYVFDAKLEKAGLTNLYRNIELPLVSVLYDMERVGFTIDTSVMDKLSEKYGSEIKELTESIRVAADEPKLNINSPKQLGELLFGKLNLQHGKKNKTGYSVSADILEELNHPIVTEILRYRKLVKLQSTYINGMRAVINANTHKVHTVFKQCQTATGRLSSTEPNLQNIPIRTEEGREIRKMFIASPGNMLVSADYSQIELRLLAHFSKDTVLLKAYAEGDDIHAVTAAKIFGKPLSDVKTGDRRDAKAVNFGIIYGISAFGLANNTGRTPYEARSFIDKYFETYPKVKEYMDSNVSFAKENGYIRTLSGRIRYFPELKSPNHNIRSFGERAAMNMPLQGSASDIIKIAMLNVAEAIKKEGYRAKLILQVHDELLIDAPAEEAESIKSLLIREMENAVKLDVPLIADAKIGADWFTME